MRLSIILLLASCVFLFVLFEIRLLKTPLIITSQASLLAAWDFIPQLRNLNAIATDANCSTAQGEADNEKFRQAVMFLPLIDVRYHKNAEDGNSWFMSSLSDKQEEGDAHYQKFPSEASDGRLLCIKGLNADNGAWNSYALAWPETLPYNATLMKGLTIVSNNHFGHENMWYNPWHGLTQLVPIVSWHIKNGCTRVPSRFVFYHRGELRTKIGKWSRTLMEATFNGPLDIEGFDFLGGDGGGGDDQAVCFEEAMVFRRNEKFMAIQRRKEACDLIRCKAWGYCNVSLAAAEDGGRGGGGIGMTLLFRTGSRSFKNETAVVGIFEKECKKVEGCLPVEGGPLRKSNSL
ncbi:hypothetical protein RHMOL_Rhmol11G0222400 [Rhododendron molle]|uniref:Uncharacterized protein n=1 Tax=Rhododendron molle TaxID=49168 RepID=A0ACC0LWC1_RHOML|nr:hypothetical protein RHMOL_Rhmol11G0222400 [Rhododendron molle]